MKTLIGSGNYNYSNNSVLKILKVCFLSALYSEDHVKILKIRTEEFFFSNSLYCVYLSDIYIFGKVYKPSYLPGCRLNCTSTVLLRQWLCHEITYEG